MRLIGQLADETAARTFGDFLYAQGIDNSVEDQKADGWAVWINDEDKVEQAAGLLHEFRTNPADSKYRAKAKEAAVRREAEEKDRDAYQKKIRDRRELFRPITAYGFGPLTFCLIVLCVVVAVLSNLGDKDEAIMPLFINSFKIYPTSYTWMPGLPDIRHGEVWRLITPIFIHSGILHLVFNMIWLRDLGSMIEARQSSWHFFFLVLIIGIGSNLTQYFWGGPSFGGMSGVVYGLLGYIWLRGKFDPGSGLFLHSSTVTMMAIWFFACFTPLIPRVANGAHAGGLVIGLAWGYLSSLRRR